MTDIAVIALSSGQEKLIKFTKIHLSLVRRHAIVVLVLIFKTRKSFEIECSDNSSLTAFSLCLSEA